MTGTGAVRPLTAVGLVVGAVLLLTACAQRGGAGTAPDGFPGASLPEDADRLVLQVGYTGGFLPPGTSIARLPLVSVYADGRVITEGPVPAIYPGPALPNLQMRRIDRTEVQALVDRALDAGVGDTTDLGRPPIADAPFTRFTVVTEEATYEREVYALFETSPRGPDPGQPGSEPGTDPGTDPGTEPWDTGLTPEQEAARTKLTDLLDALTAVGTGTDGAGGGRTGTEPATEPYEPTAVAAVVTPWSQLEEAEVVQEDRTWPGPALPGEVVDERLGIHCLAASGAEARAVLDAARSANTLTPWVAADGSRWWVTFRPLLPHETGCADLRAA